MPEDKTRKRMVVEEVGVPTETASTEEVKNEPVEEIKEKVEELQTLTQDISQSAEKSAEVQEDIVKAAEEVVSSEPVQTPPVAEPTVPQIKSSNSPNPLMIIIPGIFLLGALLGGIYFYQKGVSGVSPEASATPNYNNTVTPSPTSTPASTQLDLTKYPINVMNGSGTPGQAGTVKDLLTTAGFKVSAAGNASSYDYTKTVIKVKADVPAEFVTKLSTALSKSYVLDTNQALATSSADSVQVIVGSTKAK